MQRFIIWTAELFCPCPDVKIALLLVRGFSSWPVGVYVCEQYASEKSGYVIDTGMVWLVSVPTEDSFKMIVYLTWTAYLYFTK